MKALVILVLLAMSAVLAQDTPVEMTKYLSMVEGGQTEQVRGEIPSLLTKYPNNSGVLYLQGLVTMDGTEAVRIYQSIVDNFPKSEWADDALYKVYQFYYAIGLYRTAEIKLNQLKKDYPTSKYVGGVAAVETGSLPEEKVQPLSDPEPAGQDVNITAQPTQSSDPLAEPVRGQYALQVGAYSLQENAEKQKLFFEDLGFSVEVMNKVKDSRSLYIVLVGNYRTAEEARTKGAEVKKAYNIQSMVVTR